MLVTHFNDATFIAHSVNPHTGKCNQWISVVLSVAEAVN